jgi:hypothetical protein
MRAQPFFLPGEQVHGLVPASLHCRCLRCCGWVAAAASRQHRAAPLQVGGVGWLVRLAVAARADGGLGWAKRSLGPCCLWAVGRPLAGLHSVVFRILAELNMRAGCPCLFSLSTARCCRSHWQSPCHEGAFGRRQGHWGAAHGRGGSWPGCHLGWGELAVSRGAAGHPAMHANYVLPRTQLRRPLPADHEAF